MDPSQPSTILQFALYTSDDELAEEVRIDFTGLSLSALEDIL
jgi:hypothetical protein